MPTSKAPQTLSIDEALNEPGVSEATLETTPPPSMAQNFQQAFDELVTPRMHSKDQGVMGNVGTGLLNVGKGALSLAAPIFHPMQAVNMAGAAMQGNLGPQVAMMAPTIQSFMEHPAEMGEETAGQMLGGKLMGAAGSKVAKMTDPLREYRSPLIPQNEAVARRTADILNISPYDREGAVRTMSAQMPDVKAQLTQSGINKPRPIEFAKGAMASGKGTTDFYQKNFVEPNMDAPAGGSTVGDLYKRVTDINAELDPVYRSKDARAQMTKEASDKFRALEQERDQINENLYKTLSDRSGVPVDELRAINQRGASLQGLGGSAQYSQGLRTGGQTFGAGGFTVPMGTLDKIGRFANWFRGGTEAVKGRQLGRVLREVPETPAALPNPEDIASHRMNYLTQEQDAASANRMAAQARKPEGLGPTQRLEPVAQNPNPELLQRSARATERTAGIAKTQAANRAENLVRSLRTEELLSKARQQQAAARTLKEK